MSTDSSASGPAQVPQRRVLIEITKCMARDNDGIERYGLELLRALLPYARDPKSGWTIHVYFGMWFMFDLADVYRTVLYGEVPDDAPRSLRAVLWVNRFAYLFDHYFLRKFPAFMTLPVTLTWHVVASTLLKLATPLDFSSYDIVHLLLPQAYGTIARSETPNLVVTIHDMTHLLWPQHHNESNVLNATRGMDIAIEHGAHYICVSHATSRDLRQLMPEVAGDHVHVIHEACDADAFHPVTDAAALQAVRQKYGIPTDHYFLTLCTLEPRKNLVNTIKAFLAHVRAHPESDAVLVVAGKYGWKAKELFSDPELQSERVIFTGFVAEEDLAALYSGAIALAYVSFYEGFGLPALEAMSCGTPVLYGNNSSLPEVVGDGGLPAEAAEVDEIAQRFTELSSPEVRGRLAEAALRQSRRFSWARVAAETLEAYARVVGGVAVADAPAAPTPSADAQVG